jgi:radical SAM protein with 4Fe4S-binding SPASM domain
VQVACEDGLASHPAVATWELARPGGAVRWGEPPALTAKEAIDLLDQLEELAPAAVVLAGDPLARTDLEDLVAEAVGRGLRTALAPTVTPRATAATVTRLALRGVARVALRLDGPDAATHDALGGSPGSFAATRAVIAAVRGAGLPLELDTRLVRPAVQALPRTAALVAELRPVLWRLHFFVPAGGAERGRELGPDACERVFRFLAEWAEDAGIEVETAAAPAYRRVVVQRDVSRGRSRRPRPLPLNDGKGLLAVTPGGDVWPSTVLPLATANVRETPLADAYRQSRLFRALRDEGRLGGRCGRCAFRALCGGSRARAFAATGDFLAADPSCAWAGPAAGTAAFRG